MNKEFNKLFELTLRVLHRFCRAEKVPKDFGSGDMLYASEIHTIMSIGNNPGINITSLAELMGISKPGISQMINKLVNKEYVAKFRDKDNEKEIRLRLTDKGVTAFNGHEAYHCREFEEYKKVFETSTPNERELYKTVMLAIDRNLDEFLKQNE